MAESRGGKGYDYPDDPVRKGDRSSVLSGRAGQSRPVSGGITAGNCALSWGDRGGKSVLRNHLEDVVLTEVSNAKALSDVDERPLDGGL